LPSTQFEAETAHLCSIGFVLLAVILFALAAFVYSSRHSVAVRFLQITNVPLEGPFAAFEIKNDSDHIILADFCMVEQESSAIAPPTQLLWGETKTVQVRLPPDVQPPCRATFYFTGPVTRFNTMRERLDSLLEKFYIRVPGLTPDFSVETRVPK
jgi:hypothetical protein